VAYVLDRNLILLDRLFILLIIFFSIFNNNKKNELYFIILNPHALNAS
jgi:preprotein translocase subunit SecG